MDRARAHRAATQGERAAERAAENPAVDRLGQLGMVARGVMAFTIAAVALQIVRGGGGRAADSHGALQTLAGSAGGLVLLVVLAIAFAGHAVWRFLEAAAGLHQDSGTKRTLKRIGFAAVGVAYAVLCATTVRVVAGRHVESENQESRSATASLLSIPGGRVVTALLGVAIVGTAVGVAIWALRSGFLRTLHTEHLSARWRNAVRALGVAGQTARAAIIAVVGGFVLDAAFANDSSRAQGLDGTLRSIAQHPFGSALLFMVCAGLVVFGVFSLVQGVLLRTTGDESRAPQSKGA